MRKDICIQSRAVRAHADAHRREATSVHDVRQALHQEPSSQEPSEHPPQSPKQASLECLSIGTITRPNQARASTARTERRTGAYERRTARISSDQHGEILNS